MTTYPLSLSTAPALTDEVTLDSALDCLLTYLPIEMEGSYTLKDLFEVLLRAASVEHRVRALEGALSGNRIRYHLDKFEDMAMLEGQWNAGFRSLQLSTCPILDEFAIY